MDPVLVGYFPRCQVPARGGLPIPSLPNVQEVANVGHYTADGPPHWIDQWRHNEMWFYDSEALARKVIAEAIKNQIEPDAERDPLWPLRLSRDQRRAYDFYAYKLFPCRFVDGRQEEFALPALACEPLPADYRRLGYDPVNRTGDSHFECSPLFCNGRAMDNPVNRFCLMDDAERALALASKFSGSNGNGCEPGPYFVLEVWRKAWPEKGAPK